MKQFVCFLLFLTFDISWTRNLPDNELLLSNSSKFNGKSNNCSRNLEKDVENVKADLEKMMEKDQEIYDLFVTSYLNHTGNYMLESNTTHNDTSTFQKVLSKIKKFFKFGKNQEADCSLIKREVYANQNDLDNEFSWDDENYEKYTDYDTGLEDHKRLIKISASDVEYLKKIIDCFKTDGSSRHTNEIGDKISLTKDKDSTKICIVLKNKLRSDENLEEDREEPKKRPKPKDDSKVTEKPKKRPKVKEDFLQETTTQFSIMQERPEEHLLNSSEIANRSEAHKLDNKLKYMAHLHHDVSLTGKPPYKPIDLAKVQQLLDSVKYPANNFPFNDEDDEKNNSSQEEEITSEIPIIPYFFQDEVTRTARDSNIFDKFSKKIKDLVNKIKGNKELTTQAPELYENYDYSDDVRSDFLGKKEAGDYYDDDAGKSIRGKKKSEDLFENIFVRSPEDKEELKKHEKLEESENSAQDKKSEDEKSNDSKKEPEEKAEPTEEEDILTDLKDIQPSIDPGQQLEIESFLQQLNQHPKQFQFDFEPLLKSKLQEIEAGGVEGQMKKTNEVIDGDPKRYFEFEVEEDPMLKNKKRSANWWSKENSKEIEKLKNNLVSEYKDNYQNIYKNSINPNKYKNYLETDEKKLNDFVDHYYLLNDGGSEVKDYSKSADDSKINMIDLNIDLKLNKDFEDLEYERNLKNRNFDDTNVPFEKLEVSDNKENNYLP